MNRLKGTIKNLVATRRGRFAILGLAAMAFVIVWAIIMAVALGSTGIGPGATEIGPSASSLTPAEVGSPGQVGADLFAPLPPSGTEPVPMGENGQVEIGGPGIPANMEPVRGHGPADEANARTGLARMPLKVALPELTVRRYASDKFPTAQECASPAVPEARQIADQMVAYLYTWDASKASWSDYITPVEALWNETLWTAGNGTRLKGVADGTTWAKRVEALDLSEEKWAAWAKAGVRSEVEINQVVTTMPLSSNGPTPAYLVVTYLVTVTLSAPGVEAQSQPASLEVKLYAPCSAAGTHSGPDFERTTLQHLQVVDIKGLPAERIGW